MVGPDAFAFRLATTTPAAMQYLAQGRRYAINFIVVSSSFQRFCDQSKRDMATKIAFKKVFENLFSRNFLIYGKAE
jgi:hypothetical protein